MIIKFKLFEINKYEIDPFGEEDWGDDLTQTNAIFMIKKFSRLFNKKSKLLKSNLGDKYELKNHNVYIIRFNFMSAIDTDLSNIILNSTDISIDYENNMKYYKIKNDELNKYMSENHSDLKFMFLAKRR